MPLLRLENLELHYGNLALLDHVDFTLRKGEKVGLLGRNGAGKTTFLNVVADAIAVDSGERWVRPGTRIAWLKQALPNATEDTVYDVVAAGLAEAGEWLAQYHHMVNGEASPDMAALARVQEKLEAVDGWTLQTRVETTLSQLELDGDVRMNTLSGGWRRRVALAQALVSDPDILLMDEPTNHLDIPAIEWLEQQLRAYEGALVLITHDRRFLQNVANVMAELDRGRLTTWKGDYQGFLRHREQELEAEERANALFDRKLAAEETWIRQGIKARRTRNEGRVRALKAMRRERAERRERLGKASFHLENAERSGKVVAEIEDVSKAFDGRVVIRDFSTVIQRGDRIGIVGANGAGKSTLVKLLLGEIEPDTGTVKLGTRLEVLYSDQLRDGLDPEKSLIDNVCGGQEFITIGGRRRHAIAYLGDFLFSPDRARQPMKALSGGEQNRAVLARLFSRPANLLVLDEPTNDLDMETLELLESLLVEFDGTVLLVSHDRDFMDNVVGSLVVLDGRGGITEHVGGYSDWERSGGRLDTSPGTAEPTSAEPPDPAPAAPAGGVAPATARRLSYKEKRELEALPGEIETLEAEQAGLVAKMAEPDFYRGERQVVLQANERAAELQAQLEAAYRRWDELEARA